MLAPSDPPTAEGVANATGSTLLLQAGGARWRVACGCGAEVAPCPVPVPVPGGPPWLAGMVVHKGTALPLVDLALRLPGARGAEAPARPRGKVLVTRARGVAVALGVDDVDPDVGGDEVPLLDVEAVIGGLLEDVVAAP